MLFILFKKMLYRNYKILYHYIYLFLLISFSQQTDECPKDNPIKYQNICQLKYCSESDYNNNYCIISNSIIKTQWLNKIILIGDISYKYINPLITYYNDLILSAYPFNENKTHEIYKQKKFFGIHSNGRPFFYNKNNNLLETQKISKLNSILNKELSEVIYIRAYNTSDYQIYYDFFFILGTTAQYYETFNFEKSKTTKGDSSSFYGENPTNKKFYIETTNLKNESLLVFIGYKDSQYNLIFFGISFEYDSSFKLFKHRYNSIKDVRNTGMSSCLRTENNLFGCFYVKSNNTFSFSFLKFIYGIVDKSINNPEILETEIIDSYIQEDKDLFYKCIHLKEEIGVFAYFIRENNFYIKLNELVQRNTSYSINIIQTININKYYLNSFFDNCDLLKINDNQFLFISSTIDNLNFILLTKK